MQRSIATVSLSGTLPEKLEAIAAAGADTFVAGSAIFGQPDYHAVVAAMRERLAGVCPR